MSLEKVSLEEKMSPNENEMSQKEKVSLEEVSPKEKVFL